MHHGNWRSSHCFFCFSLSLSSTSLTPLQLERAKSTIVDLIGPRREGAVLRLGFEFENSQGQRGPSVNQRKDKMCQMKVANLSITWSLYWKVNQRLWKLASLWHMLTSGGFKAIWLGWESHQWLCSLLKAWTVWWQGLLTPQMGPFWLCRDWNRIWYSLACYQMFQACDSLPLEPLQSEDASEEQMTPLCVSFGQQNLSNIRRRSAPIRLTWSVALHTCWRRTRRSHDIIAFCLTHIKVDSRKCCVAIVFLKVSQSYGAMHTKKLQGGKIVLRNSLKSCNQLHDRENIFAELCLSCIYFGQN